MDRVVHPHVQTVYIRPSSLTDIRRMTGTAKVRGLLPIVQSYMKNRDVRKKLSAGNLIENGRGFLKGY
ncbi:MAG: hypothetical protein HW377_2651 [Actinobacteria bacterium]|nr:hypothetical protein [Actinomycetota bacterium]